MTGSEVVEIAKNAGTVVKAVKQGAEIIKAVNDNSGNGSFMDKMLNGREKEKTKQTEMKVIAAVNVISGTVTGIKDIVKSTNEVKSEQEKTKRYCKDVEQQIQEGKNETKKYIENMKDKETKLNLYINSVFHQIEQETDPNRQKELNARMDNILDSLQKELFP